MFSSRLPAALGPNALAAAVDRLRTSGAPIIDLTVTNPTSVGIPYPTSLLLSKDLASPPALTYAPEPFGMTSAREAVAREMTRISCPPHPIPSDRIVLTSSTSEAYSLLFKLLCDSGDEVLIPQPSYPLFEMLSRLDVVHAVPYRLQEHAHWSIDRESVAHALTSRTRAILVVSPNNPTGSIISGDDARWLSDICASRGIAIISDEVFADYRLSMNGKENGPIARFPDCLNFRLGGLSKSAGLPQVKLGWIFVDGPDALVAEALARLELICDTYLSVSTPVQCAAASLIEGGAAVRAAILDRIRRNLAALRTRVASSPDVTLLEPEAGWSVVIKVPATESEEQMVLRLLTDHGVLVHPGYFFDFAHEAFLVLSLLPEESVFSEGITRVLAR